MREVIGIHPYISPLISEMAGIGELSHGAMTLAVFQKVVDNLLIDKFLDVKHYQYMMKMRGGVLFHDIGKVAVDPRGIKESLEVMYPKDEISRTATGFFVPGIDVRTPELKSQQHLHPLVGGMMLHLLGIWGIIPNEWAGKWAKVAYSHAERSRDNGVKTQYPRKNGLRGENAVEDTLIILTDLCDAATAMNEVLRSYRNGKASDSEIETELKMKLSHGEMKTIMNVLAPGKKLSSGETDLLRDMLVQTVIQSAISYSPWFERDINMELMEATRLTAKTPNLLAELGQAVWKKHEKRLTETFEKQRLGVFEHLAREKVTIGN